MLKIVSELHVGGLLNDASAYKSVLSTEIVINGSSVTIESGVRGSMACVFSDAASLTPQAVGAIADLIFERTTVTFILFKRTLVLRHEPFGFSRPSLLVRKETDWVLPLPSSLIEYRQQLKGSFLKKVDYEERRLRRDLGERLHVEVLRAPGIGSAWIRDIREVWQQRLGEKGSATPTESDSYWIALAAAVRQYGLVVVLRIDGQIAAAAVTLVNNGVATLDILTHNPHYKKFGVGRIVLMLTIEQLISARVSEMHMLWGHQSYKADFGAQPVAASTFLLARSRHAWLRPHRYLSLYRQALLTFAKQHLSEDVRSRFRRTWVRLLKFKR